MSHGPYYTPEEDALIRRLFFSGQAPKDIAATLRRSDGSVYHRLKRMGLAVNTPRKVRERQAAEPFVGRHEPCPPRRFSWEDEA